MIFIAALIGGLFDPILAVGGIAAGMFWRHSRVTSAAILAALLAFMAFILYSNASNYQEDAAKVLPSLIRMALDALIWAVATALISRAVAARRESSAS